MVDVSIKAYAAALYQEIQDIVTSNMVEEFPANAFTCHCFGQVLVEAGEIEDPVVGHVERRGLMSDGVAWQDDLGRLDVVITSYHHVTEITTMSRTDVDIALRRARNFVLKARTEKLHRLLEPAHEGRDVAQTVWQKRQETTSIRLIVLTNSTVRHRQPEVDPIDGVAASVDIWDLTRLHRLESSGIGHEPIHIDLLDHEHHPLPCLVAPPSPEGIQTWLAVVPGRMLADLYDRYGARLLEGNVRSWLQARTKVNKGIRQTILEEPRRFLAYNNGITATASKVLVEDGADGPRITGITDLQIVNGGQTTATIHHALRKDRAITQLADVAVQMKLTLLPDEEAAGVMVPLISRYANSQNRISEADLSANNPFHISVEELSRTIWAPPGPDDNGLQTHWFYERARGQYQVEHGRQATPARKRDFKRNNPSKKRIVKTDLAKFELTWEQKPQVVSRGAQKCFAAFMDQLKGRNFKPDETWFRHLVAKALLFRGTEKIVQGQAFGGYRANIVTYTLALIFHRLQRRVDLEAIWSSQAIPPMLVDAITRVCHRVHDVLINPSGGIANVTEWCKKDACWDRVRKVEIDLSALIAEADKRFSGKTFKAQEEQQYARSVATATDADRSMIDVVVAPGADYWFGLSRWAKETGTLQGYQRSMAFNIGRAIARGSEPSVKLAAQGEKIMVEAKRLGYDLDAPA